MYYTPYFYNAIGGYAMAKITKSYRLEEETIKIIDKFPIGASVDEGSTTRLSYIVKMFNSVINFTKVELYQYFSRNEVDLIINALDTLESTAIIIEISPKLVLKKKIEEVIVLRSCDIQFEVNKEKFMDKIERLTEFQCFTIINMYNEVFEKVMDALSGEDNKTINDIFLIRD